MIAEREGLVAAKERLAEDREELAEERGRLLAERAGLAAERDRLALDKQQLATERAELQQGLAPLLELGHQLALGTPPGRQPALGEEGLLVENAELRKVLAPLLEQLVAVQEEGEALRAQLRLRQGVEVRAVWCGREPRAQERAARGCAARLRDAGAPRTRATNAVRWWCAERETVKV